MLSRLDGATRVCVIIGTPIVQVRSPEGITRELQRRGLNALLIPMEVASSDVAGLIAALGRVPNIDGITVTVPHKPAAFETCAAPTERACFLRAVNVMRRQPDGSFSGDHVDGESLVRALTHAGFSTGGRRGLLIGAGGAGAAIALSLLEAGIGRLTIADLETARRDDLVGRLAQRFPGAVLADNANPAGCDLVINATPAGMRSGDAAPLDTRALRPDVMVADVTTPPGVSALVAAARALGCRTIDGRTMFDAGVDLLTDFMVGPPAMR